MDGHQRLKDQVSLNMGIQVIVLGLLLGLFPRNARALFNPADGVYLSMIATNTAAALNVLKDTASLLELSQDTVQFWRSTQDDESDLDEFLREVSPEPGTREFRVSNTDVDESRMMLERLSDDIRETDAIKWESRYVDEQVHRRSKRKNSTLRLGTRVVRLGKRINKLVTRNAAEKTAYNTESLMYQNYLQSQMLSDMKTMMREKRDQEAREKIEATRNTEKAFLALISDFDFDQEILERKAKRDARLGREDSFLGRSGDLK